MKCMNEGLLQAYLDKELSLIDTHAADAHLQLCARCRELAKTIQERSERVSLLLAALAPEDLPVPCPVVPQAIALPRTASWRWAGLAIAGALAACVAILVSLPSPSVLPPPLIHRQVPAAWPVKVVTALKPRPIRHLSPQSVPDDFVTLDDSEPLQMGMVVRVTLPGVPVPGGQQDVMADLLIGEDGRARAFRFVQ